MRRNDLCICGSGKKYKKCCINTLYPADRKVNPFEDFEMTSILTGLASLTLIATNQDKIVRIEQAMNDFFKSQNSGLKSIDSAKLTQILKKNYTLNLEEDPTENCFTDLITFYGGDHLIFPGITQGGNFVLQQLIDVVFKKDSFKEFREFVSNLSTTTQFILECSNAVAKALKFTRYEFVSSDSHDLVVPGDDEMVKIQKCLQISNLKLPSFTLASSNTQKILQEFSFDINSIPQESIFVNKPFYKHGDEYYIVSPTNLCFALVNYIWRCSEKYKVHEILKREYNKVWWNSIQKDLLNIGFSRVQFNGLTTGDKTLASFYKFDNNKCAYIYIETENNQKLKHINELKDLIQSRKELSNEKIFEIALIPVYGQDGISLTERSKADLQLSMSMPEFNILTSLQLADALDLWKFSNVRCSKFKDGELIHSFSFLDEFKLYTDNDHSFYLNDNPISGILVASGMAIEWRIRYKQENDQHSQDFVFNSIPALVIVQKKNKVEKVYEAIGSSNLLFVPNYAQPVWVLPEDGNYPEEARHLVKGFIEVIAFWLSELATDLANSLRLIEEKPVYFYYKVDDWKPFIEPISEIHRGGLTAKDFKPEVTEDTITLTIPYQLFHYAYGPDNLGESKLVEALIIAMVKLLRINGQEVDIDISGVLAGVAPIGHKKMFTASFGHENLLRDATNVVGLRVLQISDVNIILDKLPDLLGDNCPPIGEIVDKKEKQVLLNQITQKALLPYLRKKIEVLDFMSLLTKLIEFNEAILFKRNQIAFEIPTKEACGFINLESKKELNKLSGQLDKTAIAIRCLIEHLSAEQHIGEDVQCPSMTDIDELIAIMNQITEWATVSDQLHFGLFDESLAILPSGRIGTGKQFQEITKEYRNIKLIDRTQDAIENFEHSFPKYYENERKELPIGLDEAFEQDYGMTFTRLCYFIDGLVEIGLNQNSGHCIFKDENLRTEIVDWDESFTQIEIDKAIEYLSLTNRGKIDKLPKGLEYYDIQPWRFNRRLSLLIKPLIVAKNRESGTKIILWGTKQLLTSRLYHQEQFETNRFRSIPNGAMERYLGKLVQQRGKELVKDMLHELTKFNHLLIDSEVEINEKSFLYSSHNLGDIDILVIDRTANLIFSLECKSLAETRNAKEMFDEFNKLYDGSHYIKKHLQRDQWIRENLELLSTKYKQDLSGFTIQSLFVTTEQLFTPILKGDKIEMPFVTLNEFRKHGYNILINLSNIMN